MQRWDADAIVLSGADSRDDKIIRLLLESDELVPALVRFARKAGKSSKSSKIQPMSRVHVTLRGKASDTLALLETVSVETPHAVLKGDLLRLSLATTMCEVVLHLIPEWGREEGVFALLARALGHLDDPSARIGEELLVLFELKLLDRFGVLPPLESLSELSASARAALEDWRQGRFSPLSPRDVRAAARFLEHALAAHSGRPLASRAFLDQIIGSG